MSFITLYAARLNILFLMRSNRDMKKLILALFFILSAGFVFAEVTVTIDGQRYFCSVDGRPPQDREWRCVPHCTRRNFDGDCMRYGQDYCGYDATCIKRCERRDTSGDCMRYGDDICRSEQ